MVSVLVRQYLEAGELAVDVAEYHSGDADVDDEFGGEQAGLGMSDSGIQEIAEQHRCGPIEYVAENESEEQRVGEEHEQGRVYLAVARSSHQICEQFHRLTLVTIGELDWWQFEFGPMVSVSAATGNDLERLDIDDSACLGKHCADLL